MPQPTLPPTIIGTPARPKLHFDWEDWLPLLEEDDIPESEKRVLIETLWSIVIGFVDLGWGLASSAEISGQDVDLTTLLNAAVLHSEGQHTETEAL